jgi:photosystem I subunit 11
MPSDNFAAVTTALTLAAVGVANTVMTPSDAFVTVQGQRAQAPTLLMKAAAPQASAREALGSKGLMAYGMAFGVAAAAARPRRTRKVARKAEGKIAVAEKSAAQMTVSYLKEIPRTIVEPALLKQLLDATPKEQWEDPPEDSYLYTLKMYAETYGPGKATKMGWFDFFYMNVNRPVADNFPVQQGFPTMEDQMAMGQRFRSISEGRIPLYIPGPSGFFNTGAWIQWRGAEPFAGDLVQSPVTDSYLGKGFIDNMAFYREGLKPWQRGLEIGVAHGYFLVGPFISLGPLRNTPEAATVGLLCGCAIVGLVSAGGLLFGSTIKPTQFDQKGEKPGAGFQSMINWHAVGGVGGAAFAHTLITVFGS